MSKGIVDLYARSQVSQQVNDRYLEALAKLDTSERVEAVVSPICRRHISKGKSIRALRPWSEPDQQLLAAVAQCGLAGDFRNRDIASRLYPHRSAQEVSAKVTYLLRLLREHKIIRRLPKTRKYRLTPNGAKIIATISLPQKATTEKLNKAAARRSGNLFQLLPVSNADMVRASRTRDKGESPPQWIVDRRLSPPRRSAIRSRSLHI